MNALLEILNKLKPMFIKYKWTSVIVSSLLLVVSVLYVFYPEIFEPVYTFLLDLYNSLFGTSQG